MGEHFRHDGVSTNGVESLWSMLKRDYVGTFHKISPQHMDRYVREFAGRHNMRERDVIVMGLSPMTRLGSGCVTES